MGTTTRAGTPTPCSEPRPVPTAPCPGGSRTRAGLGGTCARAFALLLLAGPLAAQEFLSRDRLPVVGALPHRVHALDADGDGALDLLVSSLSHLPDKLLRNDGLGSFTDASHLLPADVTWTRDVAAGDVDRDGRPDLVLAKGPSPRLYRGGASGFRDVTATHLPPLDHFPAAVALADVDGDGDLDLFSGAPRSHLLRNDGQGRFQVDGAFPGGACYAVVCAADIDGDRDVDFITDTLAASFGLAIYVNDGAGRFAARYFGVPGGDLVQDVSLGDVDGDGDPDLVVVVQGIQGGSVYPAVNDGFGNFQYLFPALPPVFQWPYKVAIVDLDADGDGDVIASGADNGRHFTTYHRNVGQHRFLASAWRVEDHRNPAVGDLDGDGDADVATLHNSEPPQAHRNLHRHLDDPLPARLAQPWALDLYDRPGYAGSFGLAVPVVAQGTVRIPLPPLGLVLVDPATAIQLPPVYLPAGRAQRTHVLVPGDPRLLGSTVYAQAVLVVPFGEVRLTNAVRATIQR